MVQKEDFEKVKREDLQYFHSQYYDLANCEICISGMTNDEQLNLINKYFGEQNLSEKETGAANEHKIVPDEKNTHYINKKDALQSAFRIGKRMIDKTHEDYLKANFVNTVLGGFFGSRLMSNLREEKGYTYGVGSGISSYNGGAYFFITSEVGKDVEGKAIEEVYKELKRLRSEEVKKEELDLIKNYMLGDFMKRADGPFAMASLFNNLRE
ncbi:MAG: M16 family metallopeptidase, partial [Flavobacteriales bacterium]